MLAFRDIFVIQIIGMLQARGFNGQAVFTFGDGLSVDSHYYQGALTHVQTSARVNGAAAVARIAWRPSGTLALQAQTGGLNRPAITLDDTLLEHMPSLPGGMPLLSRATAYRLAPTHVPGTSRHVQAGADLTRRLARPLPIGQLQEGGGADFWSALFTLSVQGQLGISYDALCNPLVTAIKEGVFNGVRKLQGNGVATALANKHTQHMSRWPLVADPVGGKFAPNIPDPVYGTAAYRDALSSLELLLGQVGAAVLNKRAHQQTLGALSPQQAGVLQLLK